MRKLRLRQNWKRTRLGIFHWSTAWTWEIETEWGRKNQRRGHVPKNWWTWGPGPAAELPPELLGEGPTPHRHLARASEWPGPLPPVVRSPRGCRVTRGAHLMAFVFEQARPQFLIQQHLQRFDNHRNNNSLQKKKKRYHHPKRERRPW